MAKIEKDYKAGKISTKEYKNAKALYRQAMNNAEYDTALIKARTEGGDLEKGAGEWVTKEDGTKEYVIKNPLDADEADRVAKKYGAKAKNVGFVTEIGVNMEKDAKG